MYMEEENNKKLAEAICNLRDLLIEDFEEEDIYTSFLWISALMYLSWSPGLMQGKKEGLRAIEAAHEEEFQMRNKETLEKAKINMEKKKGLNQNVPCEILDFTKLKRIFKKESVFKN